MLEFHQLIKYFYEFILIKFFSVYLRKHKKFKIIIYPNFCCQILLIINCQRDLSDLYLKINQTLFHGLPGFFKGLSDIQIK